MIEPVSIRDAMVIPNAENVARVVQRIYEEQLRASATKEIGRALLPVPVCDWQECPSYSLVDATSSIKRLSGNQGR